MQFVGMIFTLTRLFYLLAFWEAFHGSFFEYRLFALSWKHCQLHISLGL